MPVSVNVEVWNGAGPTETNVDGLGPPNVRLKTADDTTIDTVNPVPIPVAGFNYSYWKHVAINWGTSPTSLTNIRHHSDGAIGWTFGTGGLLNRGNRDTGDKGCPKANYQQATGAGHTQGTTGAPIEDVTNGHAYFNAQTVKVASVQGDTSGAPALIDSTDYTTAEDSHAVVLQVKVDTDATQGDQANETLTWLYDEI
jgi:hypothetical protein